MLHLLYKKEWHPSTRIRLVQMAPHLEALGLSCAIGPYPRKRAERQALVDRLGPGDRVLIHRMLIPARELDFWRRLPVPIVFDFDDAIMVRKKPIFGSYRSRGRMRAFRRTLSVCDAVLCGNSYLASTCEGSGLPVQIAPSAVPIDGPRFDERPANAVRRIGWIGLASNQVNLRLIADVLRQLAREHDFVLRIISNGDFELSGCRVENVAWGVADQERQIAALDVGIMPLGLDNEWSRGKCAYKLLQYMAAGIAAVGSNVGMNAELIQPGVNGELARDDAEWKRALGGLISDAGLRARLGSAGRKTVEASYSYDRVAPKVAEFIGNLKGRN